ncbi:hypothetical protein SAMN02745150_01482, partial [Brevinema andersonii]
EKLKEFAAHTHKKVHGIANDLKEVVKKVEDGSYDDAFDLDISKGRFKLGVKDVSGLIVIVIILGLLSIIVFGIWQVERVWELSR